MHHTDRVTVTNPVKLDSACRAVLEMPELLELILTCLPAAKNIFAVIRVSKYWQSIIDSSVKLQYKMFSRLSDKPCELWTIDTKHKPGANDFGPPMDTYNDTEFTFRRVDGSSHRAAPPVRPAIVKPLTVNPLIQVCTNYDDNHMNCYLGSPSNYTVTLRYHGWLNMAQRVETLWNTYLTDPSCDRIHVFNLNFYFGTFNAYSKNWTPLNVPANMPSGWADFERFFREKNSVGVKVCFPRPTPLQIRSNELLTMGDLLEKALETPGRASCSVPGLRSRCRTMLWKLRNWYRERILRTIVYWSRLDPGDYDIGNATMYETLDVLRKQLGIKEIPKRAYMQMSVNLYSDDRSHIITPTDKERAQADAEWESQRGFSESHPWAIDSDDDD